MKDLLIEQEGNRFVVEDHHWRFTETRLEYLAQKIRHTISVFRGEWFMDRSIGIPYIPGEDVEKDMHRRMIETALQVRIGEIEGVEKFLYFSSSMDKTTRTLTVEFTVQIDTGESFSMSVPIGA
ncbi:MAG: hypothetical protein LBQ88_15905 [Treponema sp.]|jgi:hypothetical protein|nr:hypothetical protein [Treponema sp.]